MERFRPDVVHIASPATLGYQAARAARSLGIPTVAIYQTDLVGFADRYAVPGGARAMESLTRRIHLGVDRTLAPSTASIDQLARLGIGDVARWPRGVDQELFHPGRARRGAARASSRPTASSSSGTSAGWRPRRSSSCSPTSTGSPASGWCWSAAVPRRPGCGRCCPDAAFLGVLHGDELARAYATLDVFVHTGRHETYCQSAQEALASGVPVVAPRAGGPIDVVDDTVAGYLYEPGDAAELVGPRRAARHPAGAAAADGAAPPGSSVRGRTWQAVNELLVEPLPRRERARRSVAAGPAELTDHDGDGLVDAVDEVDVRPPSRDRGPGPAAAARPAAPRSSARRPTSTIGATDDSSA